MAPPEGSSGTGRVVKPLKITLRLLHRHGACSAEKSKFKRVFPKGAPITAAAIRKAIKKGLSVNWLLLRLDLPEIKIPTCSEGVCAICEMWRQEYPEKTREAAKGIREKLRRGA